jgi:hypothetical protein
MDKTYQTKIDARQEPKVKYSPPTLKIHGRVSDLTKGGAASLRSDAGQNQMYP